MNSNLYRLVFDEAHGSWVPVAEHIRGRGKRHSRRQALAAAMLALAIGAAEAQSRPLPVPSTEAGRPFVFSGSVAGGAPSVDGNTMTIRTSDRMLGLNWKSFDIASNYTVSFKQPDVASRVLNRIWSADPSVIMGRLEADGQVYLINQNGILFGNGAQVNVGGLVASALNLSQPMLDRLLNQGLPSNRGDSQSFAWDGNYDGFAAGFVTVDSGARIASADGGRVVLLAPRTVENKGTIEGKGIETILAAGGKVVLTVPDDPSLRGLLVETDAFATRDALGNAVKLDGSVNHSGTINAGNGGVVTLAALAVNQKGMINATRAVNLNGTTMLVSGETETDRLTIHQRGDKAEIDWVSGFSIGAGKTVEFIQPDSGSVVYNFVHVNDDGRASSASNAGRSRLDGRLAANGQLFLINQLGIDIGGAASLFASNIVLSALNVHADVLTGGLIMQGEPTTRSFYLRKAQYAADDAGTADATRLKALEEFRRATVNVASGAQIRTADNGYAILAGGKVNNAGWISTPKGQAILAAGADVYLKPQFAQALRGFTAEVNPLYIRRDDLATAWEILSRAADANAVSNTGRIDAALGNITLVGHEIVQAGTLASSTSATANGSIRLLARDQMALAGMPEAGKDSLVDAKERKYDVATGQVVPYEAKDPAKFDKQTFAVGQVGGKLTLAAGSTTAVAIDGSSGKLVSDDQTFLASSVEGAAAKIVVDGHIYTPGGKVELQARDRFFADSAAFVGDPLEPAQAATPDANIGLFLGDNARIDVAGAVASKSVADLFIEVELRGDEFAANPVQRNGVLRGQKAWVDVRDPVAIADLIGWTGKVGQTVEEKAAAGGTVSLRSGGSVIVKGGAEIDVSGGRVDYAAGTVTESRVLTTTGKIERLNDVSANAQIAALGTVTRTVAAYSEGKNAGTVEVVGHSIALDGQLKATTTPGAKQRQIGDPDSDRYARPLGGRLIVQDAGQHFTVGDRLAASEAEKLAAYTQAQMVFVRGAATAAAGLAATDSAGPRLELSDNLPGAGFSRFDLQSDGRIEIPADIALDLGAGGSFAASGRQVVVGGDITAAGGSIELATRDMSDAAGQFPSFADAGYSTLVVKGGAKLSTAGVWVNDYLDRVPTRAKATTGGSITLASAYDLDLEAGSVLDVSGGGFVTADGQLEGGDAGSISLQTGNYGAPGNSAYAASSLFAAGELYGYALGKGGALAISSPFIRVGDGLIAAAGATIASNRFTQGGFAHFNLTALNNLSVAEQTTVRPTPLSWWLVSPLAYRHVASGTALAGFAPLKQLHADVRNAPTSLTLSAGRDLSIGQGSYLAVDPGGKISAAVGDEYPGQLTVLGTLEAAGGTISLTRNMPSQLDYSEDQQAKSIYLGPQAKLIADGVTRLDRATRLALEAGVTPAQLLALGRYTGSVSDGGRIEIDAGLGYLITRAGSQITAEGKTDTLSQASATGSAVAAMLPRRIGSSGGRVALAAREGMFLDGDMAAKGGEGALGGTFSLRLASNSGSKWYLQSGLPAAINKERSLALYDGGDEHAAKWVLDDEATAAYLSGTQSLALAYNGKAELDTSQLARGGFGSWYLGSVDEIHFVGTQTVAVDNQLRLDAKSYSAAAGADVTLKAAAVEIGNFAPEAGAPAAASSGTATATVEADDIALVGSFTWNDFATTTFDSRGDIHLAGVQNNVTLPGSDRKYNGRLNATGTLVLKAARVGPTAYSDFRVDLLGDPAGKIEIRRPAGVVAGDTLSVGGRSEFAANTIDHYGMVGAPLGEIVFSAPASGGKVTLHDGSVTSVAATRSSLLGKTSQSGRQWDFATATWSNGERTETSETITAVPEKRIRIDAGESTLASGATLDLSGGGEALAWEFSPGPTGKVDALLAAEGADPTLFAVLPDWLGRFSGLDAAALGLYGVSAPKATGKDESGKTTYRYDFTPALKAGDQIHIDGNGSGLAAGSYMLLPARYALLPGAYLVSVKPTSNAVVAQARQQADGSWLANATLLAASHAHGSTAYSQQPLTVELASPGVVAERGRYLLTGISDFFFDHAGARLAGDAGQLSIVGREKLLFDPSIIASRAAMVAAADGRQRAGIGLELDLAAPKLLVSDGTATAADATWSTLDQDKLVALGASSLLLGGTRSNTKEGVTGIETIADEVLVANAGNAGGTRAIEHALTAAEVMLTAQDAVTVTAGSRVESTGSAAERSIALSGDGAFLRVAEGSQAAPLRSGAKRSKGTLTVAADAAVAGRSVVLDATKETTVDGALEIGTRQSDGSRNGGALAIGASRINVVGTAALPGEGFNLRPADVARLTTVDQLRLTSYSTLDLYDNAMLGAATLKELILSAGGIAGHGAAGETATIAAQQVRFENSSGAAASFVANGKGKLQVNAGQIVFAGNVADQKTRDAGTTGFALRGFDAVDLVASGDLRFAGRGVTSIDNVGGSGNATQLTIDAGRVTTVGTADHLLTASGKTIVRGGNGLVGEDTGLGGALELRGKSVEVTALKDADGNVLKSAGRIEATAGNITLAATGGGASDGVVIGEGARLAAEGRRVAFADTAAYADGGTITLSAAAGNVAVGDGASVSVSAATDGGDAGTLNLLAAKGEVSAAAGTLRGNGGEGGTLRADAQTLRLDNLADAVTEVLAGGATEQHFTGQWDIRRRDGSLVLNENAGATKSIRAAEVSIAADNGGIDIRAGGTIDASGSKGGSIALQARNGDVELGGTLLARGKEVVKNINNAGTRGQGGDVLLASTGGKVKTVAGSVIDVGAAAGSAAQGGRVSFRADKSASIADAADLNIQLAGSVTGARDVGAEIVSYYSGNYTALNAGTTSGTTLGLTSIKKDLSDLYTTANMSALRSHLGFGSNAAFHVRPGVEIVGAASGDFTIAADLDFSTLRFADEAGVLTLRAQNNLKINNSISDGFTKAASNSTGQFLATGRDAKVGTSDASWSYRLVAGADTGAAAVTAVKGGTGGGNLDIAKDKVVRTGTGDITLAAQGNITLADRAVVYTAGRADSTAIANFASAGAAGDTSATGQRNYFTTNGGDIRVSAGGNITQAKTGSVSDWLITYSKGYDSTQWWARMASLQQGFATFGGGDIALAAGGTIDKVNAAVATNGRVPGIAGEARPDLAVIQGGGDLKVTAKTIDAGQFYAETGRLKLAAVRDIVSDTQVALGNTAAVVRAGGSASIGSIFNPLAFSQGAPKNTAGASVNTQYGNNTIGYRMRIGTYGPDSSLAIRALTGNASVAMKGGEKPVDMAPARVSVVALNGDVRANILQWPGSEGQLDLLAAQNVVVDALTQFDLPAERLPSLSNPVKGTSDAGVHPFGSDIKAASLLYSSSLWHANDREPSRIIALAGDIEGNTATSVAKFNEAATVQAGGDIKNLSIITQHASASDVTRIEAAGQVLMPSSINVSGALESRIQTSGPGRLEVFGGEGVNLGVSAGIISRGNLENPYLPEGGADIMVLAGTTTPDYAGFLAWLQGKKIAVGDVSEAGLRTVFFKLLRDSGLAAQTSAGYAGYAAGRAAIAALFPSATLKPANIDLFYSAVKTEQDGNIQLLAPAGGVTVGLASPDAKTIAEKKPSDLGLFTFRGGSIEAMLRDDFLVNQQRVFTLGGGNILVWSDRGIIDAGGGAKTVSATPPPVLVIRDGKIVLDASNSVAGSGIGTLASRDDTPLANMYLFAPDGTIDAGDAGLRSTGDITLGAQTILNASNIQAGGAVSGAPAATTAAAPVAAISTTNNENRLLEEAPTAAGRRDEASGLLTVEVLECGETRDGKRGECAENPS